jgi:hypothetical protein
MHMRIGQTHAKQCQGEHPIADLFGDGWTLHAGQYAQARVISHVRLTAMGRR